MAPPRPDSAAEVPRRPARDLIDAVVDHMRKNAEPLKYSTLVPSRYTVYLHPAEHARLEGIVPILQEQTIRALTEALDALNRRPAVKRWVDRLIGDPPEFRNADADWHVDFLADPDGEMREGDLLVDSELRLPARPELGIGERTRRITTVHSGHRTTTREHAVDRSSSSAAQPVVARITYEDNSGPHSYNVVKDSLTIGRGGIAYPVDVRIVSTVDVSREHARIRRDPATGGFFLIDLSSLGTTLNGRHVPRGYEEIDGTKRETGAETALPDAARIGLADTVFLDFRRVS
jgi:FHA domain